MSDLLPQFITSFQKALTVEMEAMRQRLGPFDVPLVNGRALAGKDDDPWKFYTFHVAKPNDKLVVQAECTLRCDKGEFLVTITDLTSEDLTIRSNHTIDLSCPPYTLVIYPWFLYEKLQRALENLLHSQDFFVAHALLAFGKSAPQRSPQPLVAEHVGLNTSQIQAIQLCSDRNVAFVWGPPGTGKTTTLGHIVTELLRQGHRILITSTTNAAVDQALAKLAELEDARDYFERGQILRIGQTSAETFGATLREVVNRLTTTMQIRVDTLRKRCFTLNQALDQIQRVLERLNSEARHLQTDLFRQASAPTIAARDISLIFSGKFTRNFLEWPVDRQRQCLIRRQQRLLRLLELCQTNIQHDRDELREKETTVVQQARVMLATMTNVYMSSLLQGERVDTVIVEEAGMAILPTVFYCAALARKKVILVGDPQQLPPIVQSNADYVYRAMGRNIFDVAASNAPHIQEMMVMLDTQYRMHPVIGSLVSALFYDGKLRNSPSTQERNAIAAQRPYPGAPLILLDTERQTTCATQEGSYSRVNAQTAQRCVELALEAVRAGITSAAIITPYAAQSRYIRQLLAQFPEEMSAVDCHTVHRFQGGERDVVILDTVDTAPLSPGVLLTDQSSRSSSANILNVSLSRARGKLVIISDVAYFQQHAPRSSINTVLQYASHAGQRVRWNEMDNYSSSCLK